MIKELRFALYAIKKNIQGSAELRTSFLTNVIGMALNNSVFIVIWVFFVQSVGIINGWTATDIIGLMGFSALAFGIVFSAGDGIRKTADYVASGSFDRFMLSPKNLLVRVGTSSFNASAFGDIVFGIVCLTAYSVMLGLGIFQILLLVLLVAISTLIFLAAAIAVYSMSFIFVDANAATSSFFEFFMTPTLFHGGAFQGVMRFVFTFIIPSLAVGALPVEIVKNISFGQLATVGTISVFWFILSLKLFYAGAKKYESTNFMTFGS